MKTINVSQAEGPVLDGLVCKALGIRYIGGYAKSWRHCGPIIEEEKITISDSLDSWVAGYNGTLRYFGPTPLIAAMRCYVASKLGETVEVPEELA